MSNQTTPAESILEGTVIPPTTNDVPVAEPKKFSRTTNALRHPVTTVKKHKLPITAAVAAVAGGVSVALLKSKLGSKDAVEVVEEDEPTNLHLLESYADTEN